MKLEKQYWQQVTAKADSTDIHGTSRLSQEDLVGNLDESRDK